MPTPEQKSGGALVLFSGGQDSTVCLAWALERFERVETVGFDYGQRHAVELTVRTTVRDKLAALKPDYAARLGEDHPVKVDALAAISETALTRDMAIEMADNGLPTTFVPGRNLLFLVLAGAIAYRRKLTQLLAAYAAGEIPLDTVTASVQGWVNHTRYGNTVGLRKAVLSKTTLPVVRLDRKEK